MTATLGAVVALTPGQARPSVVEATATLARRTRPAGFRAMVDLVHRELPEVSRGEAEEISAEMQVARIENLACRGVGVFGRDWPATIEVSGLDHLRDAHAQGRGVILWLMSFLDATPLNLVAARAGHPVTHLSAVDHLLSSHGSVSQRLVSPLLLRGERRSQGGRVVIPDGGGLGYLRELRSVIEEHHGTVTIRGDFTLGRRMIEAAHLGGTALYPTGAPSLAHQTGAVLLTTATVRRGAFDHEVIIDEPISVSRELDRRTFQREAVQEFAVRLDRRTRSNLRSRPWQPFLDWGGGHDGADRGDPDGLGQIDDASASMCRGESPQQPPRI